MSLQRKILRNNIKVHNDIELPFADKNEFGAGRSAYSERPRVRELHRIWNNYQILLNKKRLISEGVGKVKAEEAAIDILAANKAKGSRIKRTWAQNIGAVVGSVHDVREKATT